MARITESKLEEMLKPFINPERADRSAKLFFKINEEGKKEYTIPDKKERMTLYKEQCIGFGLLTRKEAREITYDDENPPYDCTINEHVGAGGVVDINGDGMG